MRIPGPIRALLVALALVLGACAQQQPANDPAAAPPEQGTFPVTIQAGNGAVTIESQPQRIVSLSPTATEILFAVGAGDQVVAVDDQSDYPEGVPTTKLSGYEPNVEAIANYEPDLVIASGAPGLKGLKDLNEPRGGRVFWLVRLEDGPTVAGQRRSSTGLAPSHRGV